MVGLGTIINTLAIVAGGLCGMLFGRFVKEGVQDGLCKACGVLSGKRLRVFRHSRGDFPGQHHGAGRCPQAPDDRWGPFQSQYDRLHPDFLRGRESGVGQKAPGSQYAPSGGSGGNCRLDMINPPKTGQQSLLSGVFNRSVVSDSPLQPAGREPIPVTGIQRAGDGTTALY